VEVEDAPVVDNAEGQRYELWLGETLAGVIVYRPRPDALALVHTEVDPAFEGRGLAAKLVAAALDDVRRRGLEILPLCPYVRSYLERHPDDADLVAPRAARSA
jgi:predicted GNAT family acetyltransferase